MDSIRIQRLRCLSDTGNIEMKPITVLVGQNSSGKSSFLRVFPLLKQSVESRTRGPILWYGRLVDFGNYQDAHQGDSEEGIVFSFNLTFNKPKENEVQYTPLSQFNRLEVIQLKVLNDLDISIQLKILENSEKGTTIIDELILRFNDSTIQITFDYNQNILSFLVNSLDVLKIGDYYFRHGYLLPLIIEAEKNSEIEMFHTPSKVMISLKERIKKLNDQLIAEIAEDDLNKIVLELGIGSSESILKQIKDTQFKQENWQKNISNWDLNNKDFQQLKDLIIANSFPLLLNICDQILKKIFNQTSYIGPVRAIAERYYRFQDLAVDEIDPQGKNLPMLIQSLTEEERKDWQDWIFKQFNFKPDIEENFGHISLKIATEESSKNINITDTGFGFSQILPIVTQLWFLVSNKSFKSLQQRDFTAEFSCKQPIIFCIEQPELHLHPRLQEILTEAFVSTIKMAQEKNIDLRLLIETHSKALINTFGDLVDSKKIAPEDINIILFEPSEKIGNITVRTAKFDANGYLCDQWPLGFLN